MISYDNETYPEIYLTGIDREEEFVIRFRKFVNTIQKKFCPDLYKRNNEIAGKETDFIVRACEGIVLDSMYCETGNPTIPQSSKKYQKAKLYFNIPDSEEIFFIYDNTVLGSCKTGFALCTSGYYYHVSKRGYIPWDKFASIDISKNFGGLKIGDEKFNLSSGDEGNKLMMILDSIQQDLR